LTSDPPILFLSSGDNARMRDLSAILFSIFSVNFVLGCSCIVASLDTTAPLLNNKFIISLFPLVVAILIGDILDAFPLPTPLTLAPRSNNIATTVTTPQDTANISGV
jgi:hypothetical protein